MLDLMPMLLMKILLDQSQDKSFKIIDVCIGYFITLFLITSLLEKILHKFLLYLVLLQNSHAEPHKILYRSPDRSCLLHLLNLEKQLIKEMSNNIRLIYLFWRYMYVAFAHCLLFKSKQTNTESKGKDFFKSWINIHVMCCLFLNCIEHLLLFYKVASFSVTI